MNQMKKHLVALDGLRGIAAILVVLSHCSKLGLLKFLPFNFIGGGKVGVWIFFCLSAFLLTKNIMEEKYAKDKDLLIARFFITRFFRIVLPYFFVIVLGVFNLYILKSSYFIWLSFSELFTHITFMAGRGVFWSVLVEVKFYILLPFFVFFLKNFSRVSTKLVIVFFAITLSIWELDTNFTKEALTLSDYLPIFLGGVLAYFLFELNPKILRLFGFPCLIFSLLMIPGVLSILAESSKIGWSLFSNIAINSFIPCLLVASLAVQSNKSIISIVLGHSIMRFFGKISFGLYLFHSPIMNAVFNKMNEFYAPVLIVSIIFALAVIAATLFFYLIERPSNALGIKISKSLTNVKL